MTRRRRAARGHGERLRDELIDAAEALLVEHGRADDVSVRAIVGRVGVSPPALYLHFADKEELFLAVCQRRFEEFGAVMAAAVEGIDDPADQLRALGEAYLEYGTDHPEHYAILFGEAVSYDVVDDPGALPGFQAFAVLVEVIRRGIEAGRFHAVDPTKAAVATWAQVHGYVTLSRQAEHLAAGGIDVPAARQVLLDQALTGLLVR